MEITYRPFVPSDPFVIETWAKVRWPMPTEGSDGKLHRIHWRDWFAAAGAAYSVEAQSGNCYVATLEGVILGFICLDCHGVILMIYVKRDFRGWNIGHGLLSAAVGRNVERGEHVFVHEPNRSFEAWASLQGLTWKRP